MGIFSKLKGEFIDIIEWLDETNDTIVHRFERYGNEIKMGAKLTVRETQVAVFINEGQLADIYKPGMYTLETENMPILSTLKGWKYGFNSPFKAEVYFVNTKKFRDQKWGTANPIPLRDPEFGPVRLRANGNYEFRIADPENFIKNVVGTDGDFTTDEVTGQLRNIVVTRFKDAIGEAKMPLLDMAANYNELSEKIQGLMANEFKNDYGIELTKFLISDITLPPQVEEALDKRSSMGIIGDMGKFMQYQTGEAIGDAANNQGGGGNGMGAGMGAGMGMGMGFGMANQMAGAMNPNQQQQQQQQQPQQGPPPPPAAAQYYIAVNGQQQGPFDMNTLKQMAANKQLTKESQVWKQGMSGWQAAGQVGELNMLWAAPPPPPPPPPSGGTPPPPAPPPAGDDKTE